MNKYKVTRKCGGIEHVTMVGAISKMSAIDKVQKQDVYDYPFKGGCWLTARRCKNE